MNANVCKETTLRDVAEAAGVSMATVSRSLNDSTLIPESTRRRVRVVADQLGFEFNAHARSLITRRVGTIGIILPPDYDRFGVQMYHGTLHNALRSVLECNDIDLIVAFLTNHFSGRNNIKKLVSRKKVDGLIIVQPVIDRDLIEFLRSKEIPFVFSHYPPPEECPADVDIIYPDNELGGLLAARHLVSIGRSRILCIGAKGDRPHHREWDLRMEGVHRGLKEAGVVPGPENELRGDMTIESGYNLVMSKRATLRDYDGIIALNDLMAIGAILAAREIGVSIPDDLAVVGYDDTDLAAAMRPSLTAVHQPREELSLVTCERLLELVRSRHAGPPPRSSVRRPVQAARRIVLSPRLVVRDSTKVVAGS
ncbi:MAG TPA: LacI family DNA-binding transcriptional regulator [Spirochaetia bacterium]|nr:LacI family DNA-binding transcriptional regulator [Spirochaetia bacterium]